MKNSIVVLMHAKDIHVIYIKPRTNEKPKELHLRQHRLRVKSILFKHVLQVDKCVVQIYNTDMNFTIALNAGHVMELDRRK